VIGGSPSPTSGTIFLSQAAQTGPAGERRTDQPTDGPFGPRRFKNFPHSTRRNDPGVAASTAAAIFARYGSMTGQLIAESETIAIFRRDKFCSF
jgi:hypothetical protein